MTKFLVLICLLFGLAASQSCNYTANLKKTYGFSKASVSMTTAKTYSDLKYCPSLKNGACCTDTDINTIGTKSDSLVAEITNYVSERDMYLTTVRTTVLPTLVTSFTSFNQIAEQFLPMFEKKINSTDYLDLALAESFEYILNMTTSFLANVDSIKANYGNYQTARRTCVIDMVDIQNSAMCLSCDPTAKSQGFTDYSSLFAGSGDIDLSDLGGFDLSDLGGLDLSDLGGFDLSDLVGIGLSDLSDLAGQYNSDDEEGYNGGQFDFNMAASTCSRLQDSCKPYLAYSVQQNQLVDAAFISQVLGGLSTGMQTYINGNTALAMTQIMTATNISTSGSHITQATSVARAELPYQCDTNGKCNWICDYLFFDGQVDINSLSLGGQQDWDTFGDRRLLAEKRKLDGSSNGQWAPARGESGKNVTFQVDPNSESSNDYSGSTTTYNSAGTSSSSDSSTKNSTSHTGIKFGSLNLGNVFIATIVVISSILFL